MTTVRGAAYSALDNLTGGRTKSHLDEIHKGLEGQDGGTRSRERLSELLRRAAGEVPYYRDRVGVGDDLSEFPVVNKAIIRQHETEMIAVGVDMRTLHVASTSGSTGAPFRVFQDAQKRRRVRADIIYWGAMAGYRPGLPLYHLRVWSDRNRIGRLSRIASNIRPVEVTRFARSDLESLLRQMAGHRGRVSVISYGSALEDIARMLQEVDAPNLPIIDFASIVSQSEAISPDARSALARILGREPVGRYGLEELGIVGQQSLGSDDYILNTPTHRVEILREDSDDPAAPGEIGRIVVTDLLNSAQPMIRYDTGDLGAFATSTDGAPDEHRLARLLGRQLDRVYDVNDEPLSPLVMYNIWWRYGEVRQYQVVQRARGDYLLRLSVRPGFRRSDEIAADFRRYVGEEANVDVELTDETFVLSSGKRKSVVSHYRPLGEGEERDGS